jgi:uncharacterized protein with HEPN domain
VKKDTKECLQDIIDTADEAIASCPSTHAEFERSRIHQRALTWLVQSVGEGCIKVPKELQAANPEIPWRAIVGTRHRIVHNYMEVDAEVIWTVVTEHLPPMVQQIKAILASLPAD